MGNKFSRTSITSNVSLDSEFNANMSEQKCHDVLERKFILDWQQEINGDNIHLILKTFKLFKLEFQSERYLYTIKKILNIGSQFQSLQLPRTCLKLNEVDTFEQLPPIASRRCPECNVIENEIHFLLECTISQNEWLQLFDKSRSMDLYFNDLLPENKLFYLIHSENERIIKWFANFAYSSFDKRSKLHSSPS